MAMHDLFLSCVSNEFHKDAGHGFISYRDDLAARLRNAGFHVEVQENFSEHGGDLLQKLEAYIKDCRVVIHLVGDMTGAVAKPDEVHALLQRCPDFLSRRPSLRTALDDCSDLSYTQWEALFALHHERPLLRYQAAVTAPRSPRYENVTAQKESQHTHWDRLKDSGIYPGTFTAQENLYVQVFEALHREHLFDGITSSGYHGIHNLPFGTLGTLFKGREDFMRDLRATPSAALARPAPPSSTLGSSRMSMMPCSSSPRLPKSSWSPASPHLPARSCSISPSKTPPLYAGCTSTLVPHLG